MVRAFAGLIACALVCGTAQAQSRLAIVQADARRAATAQDLATLRSGAGSADPQNRRAAIRALGRLERPAVLTDILLSLRSPIPELRAEAATAAAQAAQGWRTSRPAGTSAVDALAATLTERLRIETDADVRAALCESIGRLPYTQADQTVRAASTLQEAFQAHASVIDRLGVAKGFEALIRLNRTVYTAAGADASLLRALAGPENADPTAARIRRVALEALIRAGLADDQSIGHSALDQDPQVRRLAMRAAAAEGPETVPEMGLTDEAAMVRLEALRTLHELKASTLCEAAVEATGDHDAHVALVALDVLDVCGASPQALALLDALVSDTTSAETSRGWHRAAHGLVALAAAAPEQARGPVARASTGRAWPMRLYAARAARTLRDAATLEHLAADADDNVREAAIDGLSAVSGHGADRVYVGELERSGYQVIRAAAHALANSPDTDAVVAPLKAAFTRLVNEDHDNSRDARGAIAQALTSMGASVPPVKRTAPSPRATVSADELRRYASARAVITVAGVGTIDVALIASEAPVTVAGFARLAESGYYNGTTFHRVEPNFVVQGGSPGNNEYIGTDGYMPDEVGSWPHVRGSMGLSTRGRDTGDGQFFVDFVDSPRFDHEYTVFGQVLNGMDVVDQILEGDIIEKIEIVVSQ